MNPSMIYSIINLGKTLGSLNMDGENIERREKIDIDRWFPAKFFLDLTSKVNYKSKKKSEK